MQKLKTFASFGATILILCATAYGTYRLICLVIFRIISLDANVAAAIIAAAATILVSVTGILYNQRKTKEREIAESHRPQKIELYKRFMDQAVVDVLRHTKTNSIENKNVQEQFKEFFFQFTADLIVWGHPKVIKAYEAFRSCGDRPQIILKVDDILRAMRQDLGHSNRGIGKGELISLFVTDPEKLKELMETDKTA